MRPSFKIFYSFFVVVFLMAFCLSGCNKNDKQVSARVKKYVSEQGASEQIFDEDTNTVTLTHDFGVLVQPIEKEETCEFEIKNETQTAWNLKAIVNTCSCTIADMTSSKVEAGKSEKILVVYKPIGEGSFDDNRKSLVQFEEETAPKFVLYVNSRVRDPITLKPKSLSWTRVGENQTKNDSFEIQNFSEKTWDKFEVTEKPDWLTLEYKNIQPPQTEPAMKQLWLADIHVDTQGVNPGEHRGEIVLKFGENETKSLPVVLQITSAVSAIPGQLFFGDVQKNETATKNIKVVFSPDSVPKNKSEIRFEHDFGERLQWDWVSTEGETWELQASLTLNDEKIPEEPVVTMTFSNPTLPKIKLPVYVMLNTEAEP